MQTKGKTGPAKTRPLPSMKREMRRHLQGRVNHNHRDRERRDGAEFQETCSDNRAA